MQIPGYEILGPLGKGGSSTVWKARQLSLDRIVALKVLAPGMIPDEHAVELFRTEARAAARLNHRHIVQVYDAGVSEGQHYFTMEFVEGQSVGDIIARKGRMPEEDALAVVESVADALAFAWAREHIVHCDLKPDNILVERHGNVKITDLGLVRMVGGKTQNARHELILGTPNFISPEQARGDEVDFRADVYSLGATLYHMVTGVLPFAGSPGDSAMDKHIHDTLPDPTDVNPAVSGRVAWLIEKMMIKDRERRHGSWEEVLEDIRRVTDGRLPRGPLPDEGFSTIDRGEKRSKSQAAKPAAKKVVPARGMAPNLDRTIGILHRKTNPVEYAVRITVFIVAAAVTFVLAQGRYREDFRGWVAPLFKPVIPPMTNTLVGAHAPVERIAPADPAAQNGGTTVSDPGTGAAVAPTPAPAPATSQPPPSPAKPWPTDDFRRAANLFNNSLAAYNDYQKTRADARVLKRIEDNLRLAIEHFNKCRNDAPYNVDIQLYIDQCNKLIFDCHASMPAGL